MTALTIYADYIDEGESGKAVPLARPVDPAAPPVATGNVVAFRRRSAK